MKDLKKVELTVSFQVLLMKQTVLVQYICPDNHYLESWNDAEPKKDHFSLMQPAISQMFDTRQMTQTLLEMVWFNNSGL